jgi:hypothetical protein
MELLADSILSEDYKTTKVVEVGNFEVKAFLFLQFSLLGLLYNFCFFSMTFFLLSELNFWGTLGRLSDKQFLVIFHNIRT